MIALSCHKLALWLEEAILAFLSLLTHFCSLPHLTTNIPITAQWPSSRSSRTPYFFSPEWLLTQIISIIWFITLLHKHLCWQKSKSYREAGFHLLSLKLLGMSHEGINWLWKYSVSVKVVSVSRIPAELAFSLLIHRSACLFLQASFTIQHPVSAIDVADSSFLHYFTPEQVRQDTEWGTFSQGAK